MSADPRSVFLVMQDAHYEGNWRCLTVQTLMLAAEQMVALLKLAEAPGEIRIEEHKLSD